MSNELSNESRAQGRVKWYSPRKGYGFIKDEFGMDYFVHFSNILGDEAMKVLNEGQLVSFVSSKTPKGLTALEVRSEVPLG